jgi:hypothetical protein
MSDEEPHEGQESATIHYWVSNCERTSEARGSENHMLGERGGAVRIRGRERHDWRGRGRIREGGRDKEIDIRQSGHRYRCFG